MLLLSKVHILFIFLQVLLNVLFLLKNPTQETTLHLLLYFLRLLLSSSHHKKEKKMWHRESLNNLPVVS